jgi:hypothetical protein
MPWFKNIENTNPPDIGESPRLGASRIRDWKEAVCERLKGIFYGFEPDDSESDDTKKGIIGLPFHKQTSAPSESLDKIKLYAKEVNGITELFAKDSAGNDMQITSGGNAYPWRTGDLLMSSHASAPAGFSDVSATYADKFIRISSGTPLTTGGSDTHTHGAGSYASQNHSHTIPASTTYSSVVSKASTGDGRLGIKWGSGNYEINRRYINSDITTSTEGAAITGTSASANNIPAYVCVKVYSKN